MTPTQANPGERVDAPGLRVVSLPDPIVDGETRTVEPLLPSAHSRLADAKTEARAATRCLPSRDYAQLVRQIHSLVVTLTPPGAIIAVLSKGDNQLVSLKARVGWHFPQDRNGRYAGYYPADSAAAIAQLENVCFGGANYLLLPNTAFWWLDYYRDFGRHLESKYQRVWSDAGCMIFRLSSKPPSIFRYAQAKLRSLLPSFGLPGSGRDRVCRDELRLALDSRIPKKVLVGEGSAVCISGWCYHSGAEIVRLEVVTNGTAHPLKAWGVPRPDVAAAHYPHLDRSGRSYRSGFWGFVPFEKVEHPARVALALRATLIDGTVREQVLADIALEPGYTCPPAAPSGGGSPRVAICLATYNPPLALFRRQIDSIRHQTFRNWVCLISDDGSRPDIFENVCRIVGEDSRFKIHRVQIGTGFYRNFERCLSLVEDADLVALSDHDDYWHTDKLEALVNAFDKETSLVYSDMRIVDEAGCELSPTYWTTRPNNFTEFASLLMANTITGGAAMFRRELLSKILPFPEPIGEAYHDHWIGVVALAAGRVKYINRPLYDYIQHGANVIGHYAPAAPMSLFPRGSAPWRPWRTLREALELWRRVYFADLLRLQLMAQTLQLRCAGLMTATKVTELRRLARLGESYESVCWLARKALAGGGRITATVGAERPLLGAALWRHAARLRVTAKFGGAVVGPPPTGVATGAQDSHSSVEMLRGKVAPLSLKMSARAPRRLNLLIPTIDLNYFFGGYITKFNLARRLAEEGLRVRMIVVDHCDWQPAHWREQLKKFGGLEHFFDRVELAYAYDRSAGLEVNPEDTFMATTWWTGHIAHEATQAMGGGEFLYLIQEYEPFTFSMGSLAALANQSYEFPHRAIFSTELLRDYFRQNRLGVFASGTAAGEENSISFQNAITEVGEIRIEDLVRRPGRRLLFYARPESHAARNMFELGILALEEAGAEGLFNESWEFYGIGSVGSGSRIPLGGGRCLTLLPRENQQVYRDILRAHDLGLALMYTPHPSLVPIEMAAAGMVVVTNTYANKTEAALRDISANLHAVHPSLASIKRGLMEAVRRVDDYSSRVEGSRVKWPTSWEAAFNPDMLAKIQEFVVSSHSSTAAICSGGV